MNRWDADVIVIGGGTAGLAAARSLAAQSLRVIVVEARDRIGGRVWPIPLGEAGSPAELGAEFIHGTAVETMAILRAAGVAALPTGDDSWTYTENGELVRSDDEFSSAPGIFDGVRSLAEDESVDRFLRRFAGDASMRQTIASARAFVEGFDAGDPAIASARSIADEWGSGVDDTSARPAGGYGPMLECLLRECTRAGARIVLSTAALKVSWTRGDVSVDVRSEAEGARTLRARAAVVTIPIGVLRHPGNETAVTFAPELPATKLRAIAKIEMGHVVKVILRFRTAFWERIRDGRYRDASFFRLTGHAFAAYWTQFPVRDGLIVAWAGGPKAIALQGLSQAELIERALSDFGLLLGEPAMARGEFESGVVHDWSADPFARGAYSYVAVGGADARVVLGAPVENTLFFAGEATSNDGQGGTVNGALETGERAAKEAAAVLERRPVDG
jgi:monoamine oxidase